MSPNVSVIIPTFNRFKFLLNAIESARNQTYKDFEIIVVNDGSTETDYCNHNWDNDINIIHLPENTRKMFKFASANYVRNIGIQNSSGKYIAFLDDDDIWLPHKLEYQMKAIETTGCSMSCTEAYIGRGVFNPNKKYSNYISQKSFENVKGIFNKQGSYLIDNGYPTIWNKDLLKFLCPKNTSLEDLLDQANLVIGINYYGAALVSAAKRNLPIILHYVAPIEKFTDLDNTYSRFFELGEITSNSSELFNTCNKAITNENYRKDMINKTINFKEKFLDSSNLQSIDEYILAKVNR